jgi:hypothetical protein
MAEEHAGKGESASKVLDDTPQAEPAIHPITPATLTDVIEENNGNLPSGRYPRSSQETSENRFYVANPEAAGDMRAKLVRGEKFPGQRPNEVEGIPEIGAGGVWDWGDTGGGARGVNTKEGK